jgi:hypothetical protein
MKAWAKVAQVFDVKRQPTKYENESYPSEQGADESE